MTKDQQIESLRQQLQKANKTISALEQEVALLSNQNNYLKMAKNGKSVRKKCSD
nr:hypothetical protein [uncultured Draconibacterium sp.]